MSHAGEASGTRASPTSTKPSGSTRATLAYSPSTRFPISTLRRFPEALRKFDQVLNITPDDVDTLVFKAVIAQAEGDLPRAAALLAPLHPGADDTSALETQVYQAILERRPAPMITRLKEILAKPDPALGYFNGELRFWLGWAQEVAGDHAAAQESWRQARSELEPFLKEQPENYALIGDLALTNMGLGDKAAAFTLDREGDGRSPIEKDALDGPQPIEILARVAAGQENPTAPSPLYRNYSRYHTRGRWLRACRSLPRCSGSIRCSIRSGRIRASRNSPSRKHRNNSENFSDKFGHENCVILRENRKAVNLPLRR